jgi:hypothetical protein
MFLILRSLLLSLGVVLVGMGGKTVGALGVYFEGHFCTDIAHSFPFPYSPEGVGPARSRADAQKERERVFYPR